jgi:Flp pilus assembly protein TadD
MFQVNGDRYFSDSANHSRHRVQTARIFLVRALGVLVLTSMYVWPAGALTIQTAQKSKIEQELDKKNTGNKKDTGNQPPSTTKSGHTKSVSRRTTSGEFPITFVSDVTGAEISLDGKVIGIIQPDKRLRVNVKQGRYTAKASLKGYNPQSIPVAVYGQSVYTIVLGKPIPTPAPTPVSTPAPTPAASSTEPATTDEKPSPSVDDLLRRFIDPVETNKLTVADWQEVTEKADDSTEQGAARVHLGRGQLAYLARNFAESVSEFNRATAALPESGIAYYGLGNAYLATNQPIEAANAYKRAIDLTPEVAALANKGLGDSYTKLHKTKEANSHYSKARELGYLSPEINRRIAQNLMSEKQWAKALKELEAIDENNDSSAERYLLVGESLENLKRNLNAYHAYLKATELDPKSAIAFAKLGDVLFSERDFSSASEAYERALALDTTGASIDRQLIRKRANAAASQKKKPKEGK